MTVYFASIANGLGDLIVCLPILQALISTGEPVYLVQRAQTQCGLEPRIKGLAGALRESEFQLKPDEKYINLREHPLQSSHIWGSDEFEKKYPGYKIKEVLMGICRDWQIEVDFENLQPLPARPLTSIDKTSAVCLIPGSSGRVKYWPTEYWVSLYEKLKEQNFKPFIIGQPDNCEPVRILLDKGLEHLPTPSLLDALDAISGSRAVVAVDTGLMHLAVHQKIPTVSLFRYNTMFHRHYQWVRHLAAPKCSASCLELEFSKVPNTQLSYKGWGEDEVHYWKTFDCAEANQSDRCMTKIAPEAVLESLLSII